MNNTTIVRIETKSKKDYQNVLFALWSMGFSNPERSKNIYIIKNTIYVRISSCQQQKFYEDFEISYMNAKEALK